MYKLKQIFQKFGRVVMPKFLLQLGSFLANLGVTRLSGFSENFYIGKRPLEIPLCYYVLSPTQIKIFVLGMPGPSFLLMNRKDLLVALFGVVFDC